METRTKIIATIGPASATPAILNGLIKAGMDIARLNFSHGTHESHLQLINNIRAAAAARKRHIGILLDTKGPEIRLGDFQDGGVQFHKGDRFTIHMEPIIGGHTAFSLNYPNLVNEVKTGAIIKIDDGEFEIKVLAIDKVNNTLACRAMNAHFVKSRKGVNVPNTRLNIPYISPADESDLKFGCEHEIDFIAASFVRKPEDIIAIREVLEKYNRRQIPIIAKIENKQGLNNLNKIIKEADGIMVARGDMGVEIDFALVPIYQEQIIKKCRELGKPVIVATQMLESMHTNSKPTRAEVSDVALAVRQGCDCVMLSGESASGQFPIESVKTQAHIASVSEHHFKPTRSQEKTSTKRQSNVPPAYIKSVAAYDKADLIIYFDQTGTTAFAQSRTRCSSYVVLVTDSPVLARRTTLYYGLFPLLIESSFFDDLDDQKICDQARKIAKARKLKAGSTVLICVPILNMTKGITIK